MQLKDTSGRGLPLVVPGDFLEPQDKQEVCIFILSDFNLEIDMPLRLTAHEAV
jgi:hypothetical protein